MLNTENYSKRREPRRKSAREAAKLIQESPNEQLDPLLAAIRDSILGRLTVYARTDSGLLFITDGHSQNVKPKGPFMEIFGTIENGVG